MKKLLILLVLISSLISSVNAQEKAEITQEQAWGLAKQALIERDVVASEWFGGKVCVSFLDKTDSWMVSFSEKEKDRVEKGRRTTSVNVFLSRTGDVEAIFPNH